MNDKTYAERENFNRVKVIVSPVGRQGRPGTPGTSIRFFDTLQEALDLQPRPENGVTFQVREESDPENFGFYVFDDREPEGYRYLGERWDDEYLSQIENRIDTFEQEVEGLDTRVENVESDVAGFKIQVNQRVEDAEDAVQSLQDTTARYAFDTLQEAQDAWASFSQEEKDELEGKEYVTGDGIYKWTASQPVEGDFVRGFGLSVKSFETREVISEKNILDLEYIQEGIYVDIDGNLIVNSAVDAVINLPIKESTTYTFSGIESAYSKFVFFRDSEGNQVGDFQRLSSSPKTITSPPSAVAVDFNIKYADLGYENPQIEEGGEVTEYEPHVTKVITGLKNNNYSFHQPNLDPYLQEEDLELTNVISDKNILNPDYIVEGKQVVGDGVIGDSATSVSVLDLPIEGGKTYTISGVSPHSFKKIAARNAEGIVVSSSSWNFGTVPVTLTMPADAVTLDFWLFRGGDELSGELAQVEEGDQATAFEPYQTTIIKRIKGYKIAGSESDTDTTENDSELTEIINPLNPERIVVGLITNEVESSFSSYYKTLDMIPVSEGDDILVYSKEGMTPFPLRGLAAYDSEGVAVPEAGFDGTTASYVVPEGIEFIRFSFSNQYYSENLQLTRDGKVHEFDSYGEIIPVNKISNQIKEVVGVPLSGVSVLAYGDSITAGDQWLQGVQRVTGIEFKNMAIGGAHLAGLSLRDEETNPYTYGAADSSEMKDHHFTPQVDHTPNMLRHKYDITNGEFFEADGRHIFRPDVVFIAAGFNDWNNYSGFEDYADVRDLTVPQLEARLNETVEGKKIFTIIRLALEKLLGGEITETRDGMTYGVDAREAKFFFVTPIQSAATPNDPNFSLLDFGDMLQPLLEYYSITRIDGYRDAGIIRKFEIEGAQGRYLRDGIHPNDKGYTRMSQLISGKFLGAYRI